MENLGAYLRKLREDQGIAPKKVFEDIKLREDQLKMIEDNNFFELGPQGMARAMVHSYARYLGGDLDAVMAELKIMLPEKTIKEFRPKRAVREKKILLSPNLFWIVGIIIFVIVLGAILWYAHGKGWLKTPDIFNPEAADTTVVQKKAPEPAKPDPQRLRQRQLTEQIARQESGSNSAVTAQANASADNTDYLGELLPPSPVNQSLD